VNVEQEAKTEKKGMKKLAWDAHWTFGNFGDSGSFRTARRKGREKKSWLVSPRSRDRTFVSRERAINERTARKKREEGKKKTQGGGLP